MARTQRWFGATSVALGGVAWLAWLGWRVRDASPHPVWVALFSTELLGFAAGVVLALALVRTTPRSDRPDAADSVVGPASVPEAVARTLAAPPVGDVRAAIRRGREDARRRGLPLSERAVAFVLLEGGRRCATVAALVVALLLGANPYPGLTPGWFAVGALAVAATSAGLSLLTRGALRPGDRTAWSFAAIAPTLGWRDRAGTVPIDWAWVMGAVVTLNLAIALRGLSDRWTHGLPPMEHADRIATMGVALVCVAGGLLTLRRMPAPDPGVYDSAVRRVEERSARTTALGATAVVALVGLVAGILPGAVDAADHPTSEGGEGRPELEVVVDAEAQPDASEVGDSLVGAAQVPPQGSYEP
jgi:hypothetical protein